MADTLTFVLDSNLAHNIFLNSNDTLFKILYVQNSTASGSVFNWSVLIPVIVVFLGSIVTLYQVRSNTISNARIKWIQEFGVSISEYCIYAERTVLQIGLIGFKKNSSVINNKNLQGNKNFCYYKESKEYFRDYDKYSNYQGETDKYAYKIRLYLNPEEEKYKKIDSLINQIEKDASEYFYDFNDEHESRTRNNITEFINISRGIIKDEWKKAKTYKPELLRKFNEDKKKPI